MPCGCSTGILYSTLEDCASRAELGREKGIRKNQVLLGVQVNLPPTDISPEKACASCSIPAWQKLRVICSSGQTLSLGSNSWEQSAGVTKAQTKASHTYSAIWIYNHTNSLIPRGTQTPQRATQSYTLWRQSVTIAVKGTPRWHLSWGHNDNKFRRTLAANNITNTPPRGNIRNLTVKPPHAHRSANVHKHTHTHKVDTQLCSRKELHTHKQCHTQSQS